MGVVAVAVAVAMAGGLAPSPLNGPPPSPRPSVGFAASLAASVVVAETGAVVLVPVAPAGGTVLAVPSPKPVPGARVGLTPPKSPVLAGAAELVAGAVSVFGAKRFSPAVPRAVADVEVEPVPVAAVPVPSAVVPGGFKPPNILNPLVEPVVGAAVVAVVDLASNGPPAGAAVVGVVSAVADIGHQKDTQKCTGL